MTPDERRERIRELALAFPEVEVASQTGVHLKLSVRGRTFGYFLIDHHGDGRVALSCKASDGAREALITAAPGKYFVAAYSSRGWVAIDLDAPDIAPGEVEAFLAESYRLVAPRKLAEAVARQARSD